MESFKSKFNSIKEMVEYVNENFSPSQIFSYEKLVEWAEDFGMGRCDNCNREIPYDSQWD